MKLGDIIDSIFMLRAEKEKLSTEVTEINKRIEQLEMMAIDTMEDVGVDKSATGLGSVSLKIDQYPQVKDMNALVNWAHENGRADILQRRVTTSVFAEVFADTGEYPDGVDTYERKTLNYRRA